MTDPHPPYVAVVGPSECGPNLRADAHAIGAGLAARGAVVVCGGEGGVMAAAAAGARSACGTVVGLLPGTDRSSASPDLSVALPTGLGQGRNVLIVRAAQVVVAVGGSWGTLSEVALAVRMGTPVVGLRTWSVVDADAAAVSLPREGDGSGVELVTDAEQAVARAASLAGLHP